MFQHYPQREFQFIILRCDAEPEAVMDAFFEQNNATIADLIDGKYYFRDWANTFDWVQGNTQLSLSIPDNMGNNPVDLLYFTETKNVDMLNDSVISALIG